jgi:hypothetical protein
LAIVFIGAFVLLWFVYRPWALNWGATDEEVSQLMPGDSIVPAPTFNATRSVTVHAAPSAIWPWIIQIGYRRAGFYSHDRLDNDGIPSSDTIMPMYQGLREGDAIPLTATVDAEVVVLEHERAMLLVIEHDATWTWAWGLYPTGTGQTRLVTRLRVRAPTIRSKLMMDFFEIIMMRKHMLGIKQRAESMTPEMGTS